MERYPSIFNDALAPLTPGPSSSNTCGPARIGRVCRRLFGEMPARAVIAMSNFGNLKMSFRGMRTDLAFMTGFLDRDVSDPRFLRALEDGRALGLTMTDVYSDDLPGFPTALAVVTLKGKTGREMTFHTVSCGGGAFYIDSVDDCATDIRGDAFETIVMARAGGPLPDERRLKERIPGLLSVSRSSNKDGVQCVEIKSSSAVPNDITERIRRAHGVVYVASAEPVYPIVQGSGVQPPFLTSGEFAAYVEKENIPLWKAALDYETAVSGWDEDRVWERAVYLWGVIKDSVEGGFRAGNDLRGIAHARASEVRKSFSNGSLIPLGAIDIGAPIALSIMEHSNCSGVIVCIPTGGSAGIVPASIMGAAEELGKSEKECIRALLVSGLMGVFMEKTHYLGAYGCQMEIGLAAGMAAAGLVSLLDGNARQANSATVMALQSMTGLLCDKIAGFVQVPCLSRNMTATAIAMVCANAAMSGVETLVPLEEKLDSMILIGKKFIDEEINRMGDMGTPTGRRLAEEHRGERVESS